MTDEQKAAYINSQVVCARIEMEAMKMANKEKLTPGLAYGEKAFRNLIAKYQIGHNDVIGFFHS